MLMHQGSLAICFLIITLHLITQKKKKTMTENNRLPTCGDIDNRPYSKLANLQIWKHVKTQGQLDDGKGRTSKTYSGSTNASLGVTTSIDWTSTRTCKYASVNGLNASIYRSYILTSTTLKGTRWSVAKLLYGTLLDGRSGTTIGSRSGPGQGFLGRHTIWQIAKLVGCTILNGTLIASETL